MNRIPGFVIFFIVFLAIYLGMYFYVFTRSAHFFGITKNAYFYITMILVASTFIISNFLQRMMPGTTTKILYSTTSIISAAVFLLFFTILVHDIINIFYKTPALMSGIIIFGLIFVLTSYGIINALYVDVKGVEVQLKHFDKDLRIVQLSDLHLGPVHNEKYLAKIVQKVNDLDPDVVLITGDLADGVDDFNEKTVKPLNDLKAKIFFVTGNHDVMFGMEELTKILNTTNVTMLRNEAVVYKGVQIIGIDNPAEMGNSTKLGEVLKTIKLDSKKPKILMYHMPNGLEEANQNGIDLQLSGHLHNGQIDPFNSIIRLFFPRLYGLYDYNGTKLYVAAGTGTWGPPMRLGSRNEIALIKINA